MLRHRTIRKLHLNDSGELPFFQPQSVVVRDKTWKVSPVPARLQCRAVDLGDISPANTELFTKALNSPACGIQVITLYMYVMCIGGYTHNAPGHYSNCWFQITLLRHVAK